jgi:hypothetical protein
VLENLGARCRAESVLFASDLDPSVRVENRGHAEVDVGRSRRFSDSSRRQSASRSSRVPKSRKPKRTGFRSLYTRSRVRKTHEMCVCTLVTPALALESPG